MPTICMTRRPDLCYDLLLDRMHDRQHLHPAGHMVFHLCQRELQKHLLQYHRNILFFQLFTVDRKYRNLIFVKHLLRLFSDCITVRSCRIQKDHERFSQSLQFRNGSLFGFLVISCRDISKTSVAGHDDPNRGMVMDDFMRPKLCCFRKRNLLPEPWRLHHALRIIFQMPGGTLYHISHAVDQADPDRNLSSHTDLHCLFGDKFRLGGHDRLSGCRLRKFIRRPFPLMGILDIGKHEQIHKPLDKCRFPGSDRTYHADVDLSSRPFFNIIV